MNKPFDEIVGRKTICSFVFNVTQDLMNNDVVYKTKDEEISILQLLGLTVPCRYSEFVERSKEYCGNQKSLEAHQVGKLIEDFNSGKREITMEYPLIIRDGEKQVLSETLILTSDQHSGDILGQSYIREIINHEEEQLKEERIKELFRFNDALYSEIIQMQNIGVIAYRLPNYEIQVMNEKALKIYGWETSEQSKEDIIRFGKRIVYENEAETKAKLQNIQNYRNGVSYLANIVREDGSQVPVYATSKRIQIHPQRVIIVTILVAIDDIAKLAKWVGI